MGIDTEHMLDNKAEKPCVRNIKHSLPISCGSNPYHTKMKFFFYELGAEMMFHFFGSCYYHYHHSLECTLFYCTQRAIIRSVANFVLIFADG